MILSQTLSVSIKSTRWQISKNVDIFYEIVFVGVQWYVRERFREKQAKTGILDESPSLKI